MNYFEIIPSDILSHILNALPITLSYLLRKVCKRFRHTVRPLRHGYRFLVLHCAKYGYLNILKFFHNAHDEFWILEEIMYWPTIEQYTWLTEISNGLDLPSWSSIISSEAAHNGHTCLLLWMEKNYSITFDKLTLVGALHSTHLDLASMINEKIQQDASRHKKRTEYDALIDKVAVLSGKIEVLIWLENKNLINVRMVYLHALEYGDTMMIEYVFSTYNALYVLDEIDDEMFENAVINRNMSGFEWIKQYPILLHVNHILHCAAYAHIPATEYLITHGFQWDSLATVNAIRSGQLDYIQWAYDNGYIKLEPHLYYKATNLQVLEWLDEMHCPKDTTIKHIQVCEDLSVIKYMYAAGFRLSTKLIKIAIMNNNIDTVIWLHKNNCPYKDKYLNHAIQSGYDTLVIKLLQLGYKPTAYSIAYAARHNKIHLVEKFIALGVNPDEETCTCAAESGWIEILRLLLSHNCPYNLRQMLHAANVLENHDMVTWIKNNMVDNEEPAQKRMRFE